MDENYNIPEEYKPISIGGFIGYSLLFGIPCIGIILAIVFACGAVKNKNLINWARAILVLWVIGIILAIVGSSLIAYLGLSVFNMISGGL